MRARLLGVVALFVAPSAFLLPVHALADDGGGAFVDGNGDPTATAEQGSNADGTSAASDGCSWLVVVEDDFQWALYDQDGQRRFSATGRWLYKECRQVITPGVIGGQVLVPEGGAVDPQAIALAAAASAPILPPTITTSPSADRRLYTQIPTWLWVDRAWWHPYSATASAGRVTATVSATPVRGEWSLGDGAAVTCRGPGVEWRPGLPDSGTYCSHTYRHSSSGGDGDSYTLGVTVWFEITWTSNTGQGGALEAISRSAARPVQVGEIQAIETE